MFCLKDKSVVITGGGNGIGKAIAMLFAKQGALIHIIELNANAATKTVNEIKEQGGSAFAHSCNVTDQQQLVSTYQQIRVIDILVNNAGISHIGTAENTSEEDL